MAYSNKLKKQVRFQVLTAASMKMAACWVVPPVASCSLVDVYRRFRSVCCLQRENSSPYTRQKPRTQPRSSSQPWELEIWRAHLVWVRYIDRLQKKQVLLGRYHNMDGTCGGTDVPIAVCSVQLAAKCNCSDSEAAIHSQANVQSYKTHAVRVGSCARSGRVQPRYASLHTRVHTHPAVNLPVGNWGV
jgi:hypothetical protein